VADTMFFRSKKKTVLEELGVVQSEENKHVFYKSAEFHLVLTVVYAALISCGVLSASDFVNWLTLLLTIESSTSSTAVASQYELLTRESWVTKSVMSHTISFSTDCCKIDQDRLNRARTIVDRVAPTKPLATAGFSSFNSSSYNSGQFNKRKSWPDYSSNKRQKWSNWYSK
jgi:hypothetical protein